ncbi:MAG: hypothetical protein HRU13_12035 [Phycisphaerales bacterium]|nr:hypothetical protein [Phycisphaerales bacterium]
MNRHRRFLIALGIVQLLAAIAFFVLAELEVVGVNRDDATFAAIDIRETLEDRGELSVPEDATDALLQHSAIRRILLDYLYKAHGAAALVFAVFALFGLLTLIAGIVPDRKRLTASAHG